MGMQVALVIDPQEARGVSVQRVVAKEDGVMVVKVARLSPLAADFSGNLFDGAPVTRERSLKLISHFLELACLILLFLGPSCC